MIYVENMCIEAVALYVYNTIHQCIISLSNTIFQSLSHKKNNSEKLLMCQIRKFVHLKLIRMAFGILLHDHFVVLTEEPKTSAFLLRSGLGGEGKLLNESTEAEKNNGDTATCFAASFSLPPFYSINI